MYRLTITFTEKCLNGTFNADNCVYITDLPKHPTVKEVKDLIFQAIEVEGFDNSEVYINILTEKDGEYVDSDNAIITPHIVRTNIPSSFVKWDGKTPHIFAIDRENSSFDAEDA